MVLPTLPLPRRGPRTRVPRLWLHRLRPDQVHGSPLRGPLFGSDCARTPKYLYATAPEASNGRISPGKDDVLVNRHGNDRFLDSQSASGRSFQYV
jgi:hypothetical protein